MSISVSYTHLVHALEDVADALARLVHPDAVGVVDVAAAVGVTVDEVCLLYTSKITFKMNSGGCNLRNPRFMRGSRVVSELPKDQQDKNGREFTLRFSGSEKPDLVFDRCV